MSTVDKFDVVLYKCINNAHQALVRNANEIH